jgi:hypothetical protein
MAFENQPLKSIQTKYRVIQILKELKNKNITKLEPSFHPSHGIQYSEVDGESVEEQINILERLEEMGLVNGKVSKSIEKCKFCNSYRFYINLACTLCKSAQIVQGATIKHDSCGNIDFDYKYLREDNSLKCEKCNKSLKAIGIDHSKLGYFYKCLECKSILPNISNQYLCVNCGNNLGHDELSIQYLKTYFVDSKKLADTLNANAYLLSVVEELDRVGIKSELSASIIGKSDMSHVFELVIYDELKHPFIALDTLESDNKIEDILVLSFIAKSSDAHIPNKILLSIPKLRESLKALARINGIIVIESETIDEATLDLVNAITEIHNNSSSNGSIGHTYDK